MPNHAYMFIDSETTSLDTRLGDVIEASWAINQGPIRTARFPHTLDHADPEALRINRYYERGLDRFGATGGFPPREIPVPNMTHDLIRDFMGEPQPIIVAENYGFDVAMLGRKIGFEPWHYRKIELSTQARTVFGLDAPEGQAKTADRLRDLGYEIPVPDHSSHADVKCLRACFYALDEIRARHQYPAPLQQHRKKLLHRLPLVG